MYTEIRIIIEVISAIMCFVLLWFMAKPYKVAGESRALGLPLGFGFLGATYLISAFAYYAPQVFDGKLLYIQLVARTFAFLFIALTYHFSIESTENSQVITKIALSSLVSLFIISALIINLPIINLASYEMSRNCLRVINLIIVLYICIYTFRCLTKGPETITIWIPVGYTFLAVSQYSLLLFQLDGGLYAFWAALILRLIFLAILLGVTFKAFYYREKD